MKPYLTPIFFITLLLQGHAQNSIDSVLFRCPTEIAKLERTGIEQGLSQGYVPCVIQDKKGFLWIATKDGLNKYDGYNFTVYRHDPGNPASIGDNDIQKIAEDKAGRLWVFPRNKGLDLFDREHEEFIHFTYDEKNMNTLCSNVILNLLYLGNNEYLISTPVGIDLLQIRDSCDHEDSAPVNAPYFWRKQTVTITHLKPEKDHGGFDPYTGISVWQESTTKLFAHGFNDVFVIKLSPDKKHYYLVSTNFPYAAITAKQGKQLFYTFYAEDTSTHSLYYEYKGNLYRLDGQTGKWELFLPGVNIYTAFNSAISKDGFLWTTYNYKLVKIDIKNRKIFLVQSDDPSISKILSGYVCGDCYKDKANNIWITTLGYGLFKLSERQTLFHHKTIESEPLSTRKVAVNESGNFFISTWDNNHFLFDTSSMQLVRAPTWLAPAAAGSLSPNDIKILAKKQVFSRKQILESGDFYVIENGLNLVLIEPKKDFAEVIHTEKGKEFSLPLFINKNNNIWVAGTFDKVLRKINLLTSEYATINIPINDVNKNSNQQHVNQIIEDSSGNVWLATIEGVFNYKVATKRWRTFRNNSADSTTISEGPVYCLCFDPKQPMRYLWAGTNGSGLNYIDMQTGKCIHYTTKDGLPNNVVYGILSDKESNLWISTNDGLSRFNPGKKEFRNFDQSDGLQSNEFNRFSFAKSTSGWMMFGGVNGINYFNPEEISSSNYNQPVQLTNIIINNQPFNMQSSDTLLRQSVGYVDNVTLPYDKNFISFEFASLDLTAPAKNRFSYKLESIDKDWSPIRIKHDAMYTYLPPGEYVFRVRGTNSDGVFSNQEIAFHFTINPPWWKTWWAYLLYPLLAAAGIWAFIYYRSLSLFREKKKLEQQVNIRTKEAVQQKEEIAVQRDNLEKALSELKSTQVQLIQREKMASLGELAAGISHEIQNPLNFVNNFSEVNTELINELESEILNDNKEEAIAIVKDIKENEEKINYHGKRADAIVKGMLQHSRAGLGQKELTDINKLADEYIRLSYHGMRAKDKSFNADFKMEFDENVGKVNVVPQDIGRVLLNLINNAFYAVNERCKAEGEEYKALVSVTTKRINSPPTGGDGDIEIRVEDNGNGIPPNIMDKIFQPFFTTKPAGQGTGLGLSLSYDIIKSHGGEIKVKTEEGRGSEFIIQLPIS